MQFVVNAFKSAGILESNDVNTILVNLVWDLDFKQCMYGECSVCKDNDIQVNGKEKGEIKWFSWNVREHKYDEKGERRKTKIVTKTENKGTLKVWLIVSLDWSRSLRTKFPVLDKTFEPKVCNYK